jgi:PAS domain-containing protein
MDTPKNKKQTSISNKKVNATDLDNSIKKLISKSQDGIIAFDIQGKVIAMNDEAARLFGKNHNKFINQLFWHQFKLNTYSRKRQFVQARKYFQLAKDGITQHFTWIESISQNPSLLIIL